MSFEEKKSKTILNVLFINTLLYHPHIILYVSQGPHPPLGQFTDFHIAVSPQLEPPRQFT